MTTRFPLVRLTLPLLAELRARAVLEGDGPTMAACDVVASTLRRRLAELRARAALDAPSDVVSSPCTPARVKRAREHLRRLIRFRQAWEKAYQTP